MAIETLAGATRTDVVTKIANLIGDQATTEIAERVYDILGGRYLGDEYHSCVVRYTEEQWSSAVDEAFAANG